MLNIDEHDITEAVVARFANCPDPRLKQILASLVTHLHDFVRETKPTEDEWMQGIRFLTDTGQTCSAQRQEFILLSDTLGVSMLTDANGRTRFRSVVPTPCPVPTDGPVGRMLRASGRHPWRPAHVHFLIRAAGYRTLATHIFRDPDPYLDSDVVFGVRSSLIGRFEPHAGGPLADGPYTALTQRFVLAPAD